MLTIVLISLSKPVDPDGVSIKIDHQQNQESNVHAYFDQKSMWAANIIINIIPLTSLFE
ncbi:hypothetical protein [Aquimarina hainanensis]|uniref:hypothetical protein n=1 Tax=Aquimarina hainanensis TaxID=1578017 RepID=UPI003620CF64